MKRSLVAAGLLLASAVTATAADAPAETAAEACARPARVVIECVVQADGRLEQCKVVEETPSGAGYGEASLKAAAQFRMKATMPDGKSSAGEKVRIPIKYCL